MTYIDNNLTIKMFIVVLYNKSKKEDNIFNWG